MIGVQLKGRLGNQMFQYAAARTLADGWWAGWLNSRADKTVFAPQYHLGWRIGQWVPGGIEVADWEYLPAVK